ncbi:MAG: hypothetical protein DRH26_01025 [Deltaproteobacteria bacterium]|nr:MAG: hypothetical protein DRH26_01025 [Deltaproteobacteria bacterium]
MRYFVVNRNNLEIIDEIESESETALAVWDNDGVKYTRHGPTIYLFPLKKDAENLAEMLLDESVAKLEERLEQVKQKKVKLKKAK